MATAAPNGNGFKNTAATSALPAAIYAESNYRVVCSQITMTNGDSATSVYHVGWVRSNAIIDPSSFAAVQAIAGITDVSVGISGSGGQAVAAGAPKCLVADADWHAGSMTQALASALTATTVQQAAWQLAGLSADPGGNLEVYITLAAAPTGTGLVTTFLRWLKGA